MRRILISPDKFKGTLTAMQVADAIAQGIRRSRLKSDLTLLPIADGGEGTVEALLGAKIGFIRQSFPTVDALLRPRQAEVARREETFVFECAAAVGLQHIAATERNPWKSSTRGVGVLLKSAVAAGAKRILIGLGGSATNDAGLGLATEMGWQFLDAHGRRIAEPRNFALIRKVIRPSDFPNCEVLGLCDVTNPLTGPNGASFIYGPQKGLRNPQEMDEALDRVAELVAIETGIDHSERPGAGAAGGLGYGLLAFCRGQLTPGFRYISSLTGIEAALISCDLIITGEGKIDQQTIFGKAPFELAKLGRRHGKKVVAFCGTAEGGIESSGHFDQVLPLVGDQVSLADALKAPAALLEETAYRYGISMLS